MSGTQTWQTTVAGGSGTLVITTFSATSASGTFSFVAPAIASTGATASKTVTNGTFNVTF